jgi:phosphopantetheinyl transferase
MNLIAVSNSYLINSKILNKYFSLNELEYLSRNVPKEQLNNKFLGRIALKHSVTDINFSQITIDYINFGEPIIVNTPNIYCSIAHSHGLGVAASATFKLGVDVEKIRKHDESLLEDIASTEELSLFNERSKDILVTKIWVIKEAVSKALGIGIGYPFIDMRIEKEDDDYSVTTNDIKWFIKIFQYNNYIIGYCCPFKESKNCVINIKHFQ